MGAILFKKDIVSANFSFHSKAKRIQFFAMGEDDPINLSDALKIVEKYKYRDHTELYVFSTREEAEVLLMTALNRDDATGQVPCIKVRRINEVASLIDRLLYEGGYENIFESAILCEDGKKIINAWVVGMGQFGVEMTKALSWFCQMTDYYPAIHCFDARDNIERQFRALCPELLSPQINGHYDIPGESRNNILFHPGTDVTTVDLADVVDRLEPPSYVVVALGDDDLNIRVTVKLRELLLRAGCRPPIQALVRSSEKKQALDNATNFRHQPYDIQFVGDVDTQYSQACIFCSDIEQIALARHLKWGKEEDFWRYDYNYRSSVASAIHQKMKRLCHVPGIEKAPLERTEQELIGLRQLEHCRWNAFMRSEGYVYGGTVEKSGRNDLAKTHNCLVPFDDLPLAEQEKDDD